MIVTHVALTPLAGSPVRISNALNDLHIDSRVIILNPKIYGRREFPIDLAWGEEAKARLVKSDIIHFHHFFDLTKNPFNFDFKSLRGQFIRQFHTSPYTISEWTSVPADDIINSTIPQLVIAQFHTRYYPLARIVPNITPYVSETPLVSYRTPSIIYSPSNTTPAQESRWDTKGFDQVISILNRNKDIKSTVITDTPFNECHAKRMLHNIAIDDVITGSHHITSLDSLALGLATICHLDTSTQCVLQHLTGAHDIPVVNSPIWTLDDCLKTLKRDPHYLEQQGQYSAFWMSKFYHPNAMANHYIEAYQALGSTWRINRPKLNPSTILIPDLIYLKSVKKRPVTLSMIKNAFIRPLRSIKRKFFPNKQGF